MVTPAFGTELAWKIKAAKKPAMTHKRFDPDMVPFATQAQAQSKKALRTAPDRTSTDQGTRESIIHR